MRMGQPSYPSRTCLWLLQVTVTVTTLAILQCGAIAPAGGTVRVGVRRTAANLAELERLFWAISEPGNPQYQQYLTPAQLSVLRASASADTAAVVAWLHEAGCDSPTVVQTGDAVTAAHCPASHLLTPPESLASVVEFVHVDGASSNADLGSFHVAHEAPTMAQQAQSPPPQVNLGTPARQRDFYALPQSQRSRNSSNLQMVWGCGTFGVNKTELGMFYDEYCEDCDLDDVAYVFAQQACCSSNSLAR